MHKSSSHKHKHHHAEHHTSVLLEEHAEYNMSPFVKLTITLLIVVLLTILIFNFAPRPVPEQECLFEIMVCGADNQTYPSSCAARANQVPVLYYGDCGASIVCNHGGKIVCGTDGKTYPNECTALHVARVGVFSEGPCE